MIQTEEKTKARILYVDDDQENLSSFKALFRRDYDIHLASSAAEGLNILRTLPIQVLITDQRMPDMNGTELLEIVANEFPETRRFLLTAFSDFPPLVEAINQGKLQGYFSKPIDGDFIKSRIEEGLKNYYLEKTNEELLETIRANEAFLSAIVENIPDVVCVKDARDFSYVRVNRATEEILGVQRNGLLGKTSTDVFPAPLTADFDDQDRHVAATGQILDIPEERIETPSGETRTFHTKKIPIIDDHGNVRHLLCVSRDITDQRELEKRERTLDEKLRHVQKMRSIGTLAGGIAHDFNNILSSILGFAELSMLDVQLKRPVLPHLKEIFTACTRARDLVQQILSFARKSEDITVPVQVNVIATEVMKLIRATLPSTIDIRQDIEPDLTVMGNPTQFHQIFMNLCTNAAQAMDDNGGTLEVKVTRAAEKDLKTSDEGIDSSNGLIRISVSDTGCGIDPEIKDYIFDPYFTTKPPSEGTGMGLATVYGIVKSMGGDISFESRKGEGSVFTLLFPASMEKAEPHGDDPDTLPGGHERILIVDDEPSIVMILKESLEFLGYQVTQETDSLKALARFTASPDDFDLVITDLTMPNLTGDELASKIMTQRPGLPVILCTGFSRKMSEEKAMAMGIKAFIYKPIVLKDLAKLLRRILETSGQVPTGTP